MAMIDVLNSNEFGLTNLTEAVNKQPFVETYLSRLFEVSSVATETVNVERGESGIQIIDPSDYGLVAPDSTLDFERTLVTLPAVKIGRTVRLTPRDIQNVRAFGTESELATVQRIFDEKANPVRNSIEATHENLRLGALRGLQVRANGTTVIRNFFTTFGITAPDTVYFDFDNATRAQLQEAFADVASYIRAGLGNLRETGRIAIYGPRAWRRFVANAGVAQAYDRWQEGAWLRQGSLKAPFELLDFLHVEHRGLGIGDDEIRFAPVGVPGLFKTVFTPLDHMDTVNTLGLPLYVNPEMADFGKGWAAEIASLPIHFCTRPEVLIGGSANAEPVTP
jgi:hypothetical protein